MRSIPEGDGRVLVADDDAHTRTLLKDLCESWGFRVSLAGDGEEALEAAEPAPDLILLDLMMPRIDGFEVLTRLRAAPETAHVPVIVLTAVGDVEGKLKGIELGADDYVTKPFRIADLHQRIRAVIEKRRQREQRRDLDASAPAPDLGGFGMLRDGLEREIDQANRLGRPLSALIVAIDDQPLAACATAADRLRDLAQVIRKTFRDSDRVFRLDSNAFVVLMPEASREGAASAAERLVSTLQASAQGPVPFTVSAGVADFPRWGMERPDELVRAAHRALSKARRGGPSRVEVAPDPAG